MSKLLAAGLVGFFGHALRLITARVLAVAAGGLVGLAVVRVVARGFGLPDVISAGLTAGTLIIWVACVSWAVGRERRALEAGGTRPTTPRDATAADSANAEPAQSREPVSA
jgi:hypothetical protein